MGVGIAQVAAASPGGCGPAVAADDVDADGAVVVAGSGQDDGQEPAAEDGGHADEQPIGGGAWGRAVEAVDHQQPVVVTPDATFSAGPA